MYTLSPSLCGAILLKHTWSVILILLSIVILFVLILISGVFAAMEIALSSSNRTKVMMLAESGDKKAKKLLDAIEEPLSFFATTQIYITFITLFSGMYAAEVFTDPIVDWALEQNFPVSHVVVAPVVFILVTAVLTYFTLVFGELIPKRIALRKGIVFALATINLLNFLSKLVLPFVKLLSFSAGLLLKLFRVKDDEDEEEITKEEIKFILDASTESGNIDEVEHDMLNRVLELHDRTVVDTCVHRVDMVALPVSASYQEVVDLFIDKKYSRIPIYEENIDHIKGILHIKDIMEFAFGSKDTSEFDLLSLLHEPYFVPTMKCADELLREMQKNATYMAIVVDEHGGTFGVVTIEDLVEEIVGSISDEYDTDEEQDVVVTGCGSSILQGSMELAKVEDHFGIDLPVDEYDTLSGFLIGQLRRIPLEDETPELEYNGILFKVRKIQDNRIVEAIAEVPVDQE